MCRNEPTVSREAAIGQARMLRNLGRSQDALDALESAKDWPESPLRHLADFEKSFFYSDSLNDLPLLEVVTHPIVTNPSESLLRVARDRDWPVINLFNQVVDQKT